MKGYVENIERVTLDNAERALQQDTYFWRSAMDHLADNEGRERAGRVDFEYNFPDSTWLRMFCFGGCVAVKAAARRLQNTAPHKFLLKCCTAPYIVHCNIRIEHWR